MPLRYLLLDLDGTLLPMDMDEFLGAYLRLLARRLAAYMPPERFVRELMTSTDIMIHNLDPDRTNEDVFMADFFSRTGLPQAEVRPVFDDFYARDFRTLIDHTQPSSLARAIVEEAQKRGLELVIATNPLFPLKAIRERMRWAGVADIPFRLVTAYEDMHFCKPYPYYYEEILERIGARAEECLMAGNDIDEDLVAGQVGMRTFLVEDCLINRRGRNAVADYRGSLAHLLAFVKELAP
ncbi:MAG: HAD family hydrolase [Thermoanaerobacterales bacterium]|nr:HAD family hydrolase [Bacillota bacterium]MDI6906180.1 HAD family hydrolase [Thermoanaerobacterales bacterium]